MLFSDRLKLEKEYYEWVDKANAEFKAKGDYARVKDCPQSVFVFLQCKGLLFDEKSVAKKTYEWLDKKGYLNIEPYGLESVKKEMIKELFGRE